jgi:LemA protein
MSHEKETLEAVISARNSASSNLKSAAANPGDASAIQGLAGSEGILSSAMSRFSMVMEAYPDLKANQNMMQLTEELSSTENKVAFSRQSFNDSVTEYNSFRQSFPPIFFANLFGHNKDAKLLEFEDSAQIQSAPKVSF